MIAYTAGTRTRIKVDDCSIDGIHDTELGMRNGIATVTCPCCQGEGEHHHGRGPYTGSCSCDSCHGAGHFSVNL